jgi:AcrR family transcriptional regulator
MADELSLESKRRGQIISAARQVFSSKGYDGATVEEIAETAGVSKGLIYNYFRSKEDILLATAEALMSRFEEHMERMSTAEATASDKILAAQHMHTGEMIKEWDFVQIMLEFWSESVRRPEIARPYAQMFRHARTYLETTIENGIASGEFRPVAAKEVASLMIAMADGLTIQRMLDARAFNWQNVSRAMDDLLFNGLLAPGEDG